MKTYPNHPMTDAEARQALADACKQVETNLRCTPGSARIIPV